MEKPKGAWAVVNRVLNSRNVFRAFLNNNQAEAWEKFPMKEAYLAVTVNFGPVQWKKQAWGSWHVAKASFIFWLCVHRGLQTSDKVARWKEGVNESCILCSTELETCDHLFFRCGYSAIVLLKCLAAVKLRAPPYD